MKLNLGCGKEYKHGYINIDAFDQTIADIKMSVNNLKYPPNSVTEIIASQLLEHFGIIKCIYSLSEWFRVLKPTGNLIIETPDLEKTFKYYINGDYKLKKNILSWIYGLPFQGMSHKLCFPIDLLQGLLEKSGFIEIKKTFSEVEKNHPTLKITCKKNPNYQPYQAISNFRKKIIQKKIVDINNYYLAIEQEKLIDFFLLKIKQFLNKKDFEILEEIVIEGGIRNPKMTHVFLEECIKNQLMVKENIKKYLDVLDFLNYINYPSIQVHLIKESPCIPGTQEKTFEMIYKIGKKSIKKLIATDGDYNVKNSILKLASICNVRKTSFFSEELIDRDASSFFIQGIKMFFLKNYNEAIDKIKEAIKLNRNNILFFWNLGRLQSITGKFQEAKINYENAIKLVEIGNLIKNKKIIDSIEEEINNNSLKVIKIPITKL